MLLATSIPGLSGRNEGGGLNLSFQGPKNAAACILRFPTRQITPSRSLEFGRRDFDKEPGNTERIDPGPRWEQYIP